MTEKELRQKVVDTANAWKGLKQSNGSYNVIIDTYNNHKPLPRGYAVKKGSDAWCATFVSSVGIKCNLTDIMFKECSCHQMISLYNKAGRWVENDAYVPKIADIVMYDWGDSGSGDNKGTADHVGIVTAISGNTMTIIEGNLNYAVGTRKLSVNGKYIRGYCIPDYASKADGKSESAETYVVNATGEFNSKAEAESALKKVETLGFTGSVTTKEGEKAEVVKPKEITVGSKVKVKSGAKYYDGKTPNPIIYDRTHKVHSMNGERVVIEYTGIIIGAVHKNNLTLV